MSLNPRNLRLVKGITAVAVVVSVLACLVPALMGQARQLSERIADFHWIPLVTAFALSAVYWPVNAYVWNMVLRALGHSLPGTTAVRVWLATQTCRWLPGGVWHYGSRTMQSVALGISSTVAVASMALELLLTVVACAVLVLVGIAVYGSSQLSMDQVFSLQTLGLVLMGCLAVALLVALASMSWRWFPEKYQALQERFASLRLVKVRTWPTLACFLVYLVLSVVNGIAFYAVILAVSPDSHVPLLAAVAANSAAWLVGLFAFMAPGGLVVREAALAVQLGFWMPITEALLVAVLWRFVQLAVELVCVAAAYAPRSIGSRLIGPNRFTPSKRRGASPGDSNPSLRTVMEIPAKP